MKFTRWPNGQGAYQTLTRHSTFFTFVAVLSIELVLSYGLALGMTQSQFRFVIKQTSSLIPGESNPRLP